MGRKSWLQKRVENVALPLLVVYGVTRDHRAGDASRRNPLP